MKTCDWLAEEMEDVEGVEAAMGCPATPGDVVCVLFAVAVWLILLVTRRR